MSVSSFEPVDVVPSISRKKNTDDNTAKVHVSNPTIVKFWLIGAGIVFLAYIAFQSLEFLYLVLTAYILSIALEAIVMYLFNKWLSRGASIALTYLFFFLFIVSWFVLIVPFLVTQMTAIINSVISSVLAFQSELIQFGLQGMVQNAAWLPAYAKQSLVDILSDPALNIKIQNALQTNISQIVWIGSSYAQNIGNFIVTLFSQFVIIVTKFFIVLTLAVMFSLEKKGVMRFVAGLWGQAEYTFVYAKLDRIYQRLGHWLKGQLLLCIYIGIIVAVVLQVIGWLGLDLPNKWSLALISWLTEFIPYVGPLLWGIPAWLLALTHYGLWGFGIIFILYWFIQWTENNILIPYVMNKTLGLSPIVIFLCVLLGGLVLGFVGVVIGVPLAVIITMIYDDNE